MSLNEREGHFVFWMQCCEAIWYVYRCKQR